MAKEIRVAVMSLSTPVESCLFCIIYDLGILSTHLHPYVEDFFLVCSIDIYRMFSLAQFWCLQRDPARLLSGQRFEFEYKGVEECVRSKIPCMSF